MKKYSIIFTAVFLSFLFFNFTMQNQPNDAVIPEDGGLNMPADVKTVIDNSCYGCHNTDSKNEKGKKKLNFDSFGTDYSAIKSGGKLKEVANVVTDGDMPPEKYLEHNPENALTEAQKTLLTDWARTEAAKYKEKK